MLLRSWLTSSLLLGAFLGLAPTAGAQAPDTRNIRPAIMIALDSSGSMERLPTCTCSSPSCNECLPVCAANAQNRWSVVAEALTGSYNGFTCTAIDRSVAYPGEYDENYFLPFHQIGFTSQNNDGVLDVYIDRAKFGLMTYDNVATLTGQDILVPVASWTAGYSSNSNGSQGMYSYAYERPFNFPGCATDYQINLGGRSDVPPGGGDILGGEVPGNLVSVGDDAADHVAINGRIQNSLLAMRPYGATPTAALLDDVRYYFSNHADVVPVTVLGGGGDVYAACRNKYVVLITDGYPNADFRGDPYNCDACVDDDMDPGTPDVCYTCPYETPEEIAADLCQWNASTGLCEGEVDGVFAVGFDMTDAAAIARLDAIAAVGGTGSAIIADGTYTSLQAAIASAIDQAAPGTTTRTVPAFANTVGGTLDQHQFSSGFKLATVPGEPWHGVLERRRYECSGATVVEQPVDATDRFHDVLNAQSARTLYTVLPTDVADQDGWLTGAGAGVLPLALTPTSIGTPDETGLSLVTFDTTNVTPSHLNVPDTTTRDAVVNWIHATDPSVPDSRGDNRLGDIYHSSPVIKAPSRLDSADESFNAFRVAVADQPTVLYVGTNDGILHAFRVSDDPKTIGVDERGQELWGFIPPALLQSLEGATNSHQWMVDGSPVVKDVITARLPGAAVSASQFRTVLIVGLRGGGNSYFALDVSEPLTPKFLWQFTEADMGETYGKAGLGTVLVDFGGGNLHERSVAILPGGDGTVGAGDCAPAAAAQPGTVSGISPRTDRRCWVGSEGRALYVVDVTTGLLLRKFDHTHISSPMIGGVSLFNGNQGVNSIRAYMSDRDGVLWRLRMEDVDPANWDVEPMFDMFHDLGAQDGQPSYYPPVVSVDDVGNVVIVQGSGDIDLLDSVAKNRIVSLTESITFSGAGATTGVTDTLNWEITTAAGEQVTGPLTLFQSRIYFGTFVSDVSALDACNFGFSRLYGVHYLLDDGSASTPPYPLEGLESTPGSGVEDAHFVGPFTNQIVMGATVTQRPTCFQGTVVTDPYLGSRYQVNNRGGGGFQLVTQIGGDSDPTDPAEIVINTRDLALTVERTRQLSRGANVD